MKVVEKIFRGSIICRVLGYPISHGIAKLLLEKGKMNLQSIAKYVKRSMAAVCFQLTKLRLASVIRDERKGKTRTYWIKYPSEIKKLLDACKLLVSRISQRLDNDY